MLSSKNDKWTSESILARFPVLTSLSLMMEVRARAGVSETGTLDVGLPVEIKCGLHFRLRRNWDEPDRGCLFVGWFGELEQA